MSTVNSLDSYFTNLIVSLMNVERQPLMRLEAQRDSINVRRGAFEDVKTRLQSLQDLVQSLISTDPFNVVKAGRSAVVSNATGGATVLTAQSSSSAVPGLYDISVTQLASAQCRGSAAQSSIDLSLGLSGTFWLGGHGTASASVTPNGTVSGAGTAEVASGQKELGSGTYYVETRLEEGVLQFRLKDVDGKVVPSLNQGGSFTGSWQDVEAGVYDTGRGLTISFSGSGVDASTAVSYTAAGVGVEVVSTDSLIDIAGKINDVSQPVGRDVTASIVGNQLVLTAANSGTAHTMIYTDEVGLGFSDVDLQPAQDALFTVNNISFTRSGNSGLTDIIYGVTLNLAADAEGQSATLTIQKDLSAVQKAVEDFLTSFNDVQTYLQSKTAVTSVGSGDGVTYVRGTLANDNIFNDLRTDLFSRFASITPNAGIFRSLNQIGLTIDENLQATVSDPDKLSAALTENLDSVVSLLDAVMGSVDTLLGRFTGTSSGYLASTLASMDEQVIEIEGEIQDLNERLEQRQNALTDQFGAVQAQLLSLSYMQQLWSGIYGSVNSLV